MNLSEALELPEKGIISIVGAGGKSTLLIRLSKELADRGKRVVTLTTTQITRAQGESCGFLFTGDDCQTFREIMELHNAICIASPAKDPCKLAAPAEAILIEALRLADWVIAESDGAHELPVKAPASYEPVLLPEGLVIAAAGISALNHPLKHVCHRSHLAAALLGVSEDAVLTPSMLAQLITSEQGQFKNVKDPRRFRVILNQADISPDLAKETASEIKKRMHDCKVIVTSLQKNIRF